MAAYVTYTDAALDGQAATTRVVERVFASQAAADTRAGEVGGVSAYRGAVPDVVDVGDLISTATGALVAASAPTEAEALTAAWRERLHAAWRQYAAGGPHPATGRQGWWASMPDGVAASTAVDRRMFAQVALGDLIASGAYAPSVGAAIRATALEHIESVLLGDGAAMYAPRAGHAGGTGGVERHGPRRGQRPLLRRHRRRDAADAHRGRRSHRGRRRRRPRRLQPRLIHAEVGDTP